MTKMQIVHFCRIDLCTMVKNVPCAWQFICKASSNTLCTLFVQTNSSTCNYETPQRRSGQFDNTAGPHFSLGLRNYQWSTSSRKQHEIMTASQYSFWSTHIVLLTLKCSPSLERTWNCSQPTGKTKPDWTSEHKDFGEKEGRTPFLT